MGYVIVAKATRPGNETGHHVTTRWRSDDPWGAIWRCLYDSLSGYIPWPPGNEKMAIADVQIRVTFEPDKEDFVSGIFPPDPLEIHRRDTQHVGRKPNHGKIPKD